MIKDNIEKVRHEIDRCRKNCRYKINDEPVLLVAVTKNHEVAAMREAVDASVTDIGENRVQEAKRKLPLLEREATWHLIGHLQTNKVKDAVKYFSLIHSVDSIHLAEAINKAAADAKKIQDILIQINLVKEESKSGVYEEDLPALLAAMKKLYALRLCGLMFIAPNYDDPEKCRRHFARMREIFTQTSKDSDFSATMKYLSMGMSHDYKIAVEEGANIVRVGTAIFGERDYTKEA